MAQVSPVPSRLCQHPPPLSRFEVMLIEFEPAQLKISKAAVSAQNSEGLTGEKPSNNTNSVPTGAVDEKVRYFV